MATAGAPISRRRWLGAVAVLAACTRGSDDPALVVMAAASLTDVLPRVGAAWTERGGDPAPTFVFDATSRLAKQLEAGAEADVFFSADAEWMDTLGASGQIDAASRVDLLGNRLVVVVPAATATPPKTPGDLRGLRLALAGSSVPAGKYARASLESLGVWADVAASVVEGDNVRAALQWVARAEADAGIVYATDAAVEPKVRVAFELPATSHPKIVYPVAVVTASRRRAAAERFVAFCGGASAREIFVAAGFSAP